MTGIAYWRRPTPPSRLEHPLDQPDAGADVPKTDSRPDLVKFLGRRSCSTHDLEKTRTPRNLGFPAVSISEWAKRVLARPDAKERVARYRAEVMPGPPVRRPLDASGDAVCGDHRDACPGAVRDAWREARDVVPPARTSRSNDRVGTFFDAAPAAEPRPDRSVRSRFPSTRCAADA